MPKMPWETMQPGNLGPVEKPPGYEMWPVASRGLRFWAWFGFAVAVFLILGVIW